MEFSTSAAKLIFACSRGNLEQVKELLSSGSYQNVNELLPGSDTTPLFLACLHGHLSLIMYLVKEKSANANFALPGLQLTPLMELASCSSQQKSHLVESAMVLIDAGADVNSADKNGFTPLMFAVKARNYSLVSYLINKGANVNGRDRLGRSALFLAAGFGNRQLCHLLLERGADINLVDHGGWTAADVAQMKRFTKLAELLYRAGKCDADLKTILTALSSVKFDKQSVEMEQRAESTLESLLAASGGRKYLDDLNGLTFAQILNIQEDQLKALGVWEVGIRQRILANVKKIHTADWTNTALKCIPRNKAVTSGVMASYLRNIDLQLKMIQSTMDFLKMRLEDGNAKNPAQKRERLKYTLQQCQYIACKADVVFQENGLLDALEQLKVGPKKNVLRVAGQLEPCEPSTDFWKFRGTMSYLLWTLFRSNFHQV